MLDSVKSHSA